MRFIKEGMDEKEKKGALLEVQPRTELNLVKQMCLLIDILIEDTKFMESMEEELLNRIFIFACVWGLGGNLEFNERKKFNDKFKALLEADDTQVNVAAKS